MPSIFSIWARIASGPGGGFVAMKSSKLFHAVKTGSAVGALDDGFTPVVGFADPGSLNIMATSTVASATKPTMLPMSSGSFDFGAAASRGSGTWGLLPGPRTFDGGFTALSPAEEPD